MHRQKLYSPEASPRGKEQAVGQPSGPHSLPQPLPVPPSSISTPHRKCKPSSVKISTCRDRNSSSSFELCSSPGPVTPNISTWGGAGILGQRGPGWWRGPVNATQACTTHLSEVMDSVQPPRLLPSVCLCPVAGTGTDHPSRKMGDWVREGRCYQWV